jgi:hypothetical protein
MAGLKYDKDVGTVFLSLIIQHTNAVKERLDSK